MKYRLKITCALGDAGTEITEHVYKESVPFQNKHLYEAIEEPKPADEPIAEAVPEVIAEVTPEPVIETPVVETTGEVIPEIADVPAIVEEPIVEEAPIVVEEVIEETKVEEKSAKVKKK